MRRKNLISLLKRKENIILILYCRNFSFLSLRRFLIGYWPFLALQKFQYLSKMDWYFRNIFCSCYSRNTGGTLPPWPHCKNLLFRLVTITYRLCLVCVAKLISIKRNLVLLSWFYKMRYKNLFRAKNNYISRIWCALQKLWKEWFLPFILTFKSALQNLGEK